MTGMNRTTNEQLDRLVDGELPPEERATLLDGLENESDGWRRCAVAFLEAQAWNEALGETVSPRVDVERRDVKRSSKNSTTKWSNWVSVAALIVFAFGLGVASERMPDITPMTTQANNDDAANPPSSGAIAANTPHDNSLTLVMDGEDGEPQQVRLPIVDAEVGREWFDQDAGRNQQQFIHEQVRRSGRQVRTRDRFWAPIETHDGQRFVVPVEEWRLSPVSHRQFQ